MSCGSDLILIPCVFEMLLVLKVLSPMHLLGKAFRVLYSVAPL